MLSVSLFYQREVFERMETTTSGIDIPVEVIGSDIHSVKQEPSDEYCNADSHCYVKQEPAGEFEPIGPCHPVQVNNFYAFYSAMLRRVRLCHSMSSVHLSITFRSLALQMYWARLSVITHLHSNIMQIFSRSAVKLNSEHSHLSFQGRPKQPVFF